MNIRVTVRFGGANEITRDFPAGTTVNTILNTVRGALGFGANVQAMIARRHVEGNYPVGQDVVIDVETKANQKAADVNVTIQFGGANSIRRSFPEGTTIGDIKSNRDVLGALGVGGNVRALINRVEQEDEVAVESGDTIVLETVANQKAA